MLAEPMSGLGCRFRDGLDRGGVRVVEREGARFQGLQRCRVRFELILKIHKVEFIQTLAPTWETRPRGKNRSFQEVILGWEGFPREL